jgi:hypothetical protein
MNPDIQMQMRVSELMLEKVVLDTKIQRAVLASQRLTHHEEDLSEMIDDLLSDRKTTRRETLADRKLARSSFDSPTKIKAMRIPGWFERTLFKLFSGRS